MLVVGTITWVVVASNDDGDSPTTVVPAGLRNGGPRAGDTAPDFTLKTLDGKTVSLSDYKGKPVVLNFWASWCNPCREEFGLFRDQVAKSGGSFAMLGVDNRDIASDAQSFAKQQHATWAIVDDSSTAVTKAYGVTGLPQTFFIKPDGTIAVRFYLGIPDAAHFRAALAKITEPAAT